jgi:fatty acid desaturase
MNKKELIAREKTPTALNIVIQVLASATSLFCLWSASHFGSWWIKIAAALVFSFSNNTLFSLLHESVHRCYSKNKMINETAGNLAAAFFPTALVFQRTCHLGHHLRNRTDHEMFDMYYPDDNKFLKFTQFYAILSGFYWLSLPFGCLLYLFVPWSYNMFKHMAKSTDAEMMLPFINHPFKTRIRVEMLYSFLFQVAVFYFLKLNFTGWILCYWIFGMNWGGLQYADHAWTERDIRHGAWNLYVPKWMEAVFLNYHWHKEHHAHPQAPWTVLPKLADQNGMRPSFIKIYLEMWKGPRPVNAPKPKPIDDEVRRLIEEQEFENGRAV